VVHEPQCTFSNGGACMVKKELEKEKGERQKGQAKWRKAKQNKDEHQDIHEGPQDQKTNTEAQRNHTLGGVQFKQQLPKTQTNITTNSPKQTKPLTIR
tara:strand:+ start:214 stop:507 length:294 start_codon:yes stop_codon:yes gene_type:complete